jgi:hypothetical protein
MEGSMSLKKNIDLIKRPEKIREALYANSPAVLEFAFRDDPNVRAVISAGRKALPVIEKELKSNGAALHDISLSCLAYILSKIDVKEAARMLRPLYPKVVERPGSIAAIFIARPLRIDRNLPVGTGELHFTPEQLRETLKCIEP